MTGRRTLRTLCAVAATAATLPYLVDGVYHLLGAPDATFPPRGHALLQGFMALAAFSFYFANLPDIRRLAVAGLSTALTMHFGEPTLLWLTGATANTNADGFRVLYGICALFVYVFWYLLIQIRRLSCILG